MMAVEGVTGYILLIKLLSYTAQHIGYTTFNQTYSSSSSMAQWPNAVRGLLWTSDQPVAVVPDKTQHSQEIKSMPPPPAGFEPILTYSMEQSPS
jgi:hypothetical protein